ncbi:hypothetical protein QCN27_10055 [Cereibacter sp. SYSU M97828]|nr:hypothetical protein [Cereibacter flavus]
MAHPIDIPPIRDDGLQLREDRAAQNRMWALQRAAWALFLLICLAALCGATGSGGWLHKREASFVSGAAEMPRISRWEGSDDMSITLTKNEPTHEITIGQPFFDKFAIERIQPEPAETSLSRLGQSFRFPTSGQPPHKITIDFRPIHFGLASFDLTIGGQTQNLSTLILP